MRISPSPENRRPLVAILGGHLRQRGGHVELGYRAGGGPDALCLRGSALADIGEQLALERPGFFLRRRAP